MSHPRGAATPGQDHEPFDQLAVGWALHALEPDEEVVVAGHLPVCPRCRRTVAQTWETMGALAAGLPPAEPPPRLRSRLLAAVDATEQALPLSGGAADPDDAPPPDPGRSTPRVATGFPDYRPTPSREPDPSPAAWRRVLPNALAAAAVATILALGTWNVVLGSARDEAQATAAEQAEILNALLQPGRATIAPLSGRDGAPIATVVARDGRVQLITHGLAVNDSDSTTYVVWGLRDAAPTALATFDVIRPQMGLQTVGSGWTGLGDFTSFVISIEPGRHAPSEPTGTVATGQVTS